MSSRQLVQLLTDRAWENENFLTQVKHCLATTKTSVYCQHSSILNPKHRTVPVTRKKTNSTPAETRTIGSKLKRRSCFRCNEPRKMSSLRKWVEIFLQQMCMEETDYKKQTHRSQSTLFGADSLCKGLLKSKKQFYISFLHFPGQTCCPQEDLFQKFIRVLILWHSPLGCLQ